MRREVAEETGVPVGTVTYIASQGWPFPSGVMIGFRATALAESVHAQELIGGVDGSALMLHRPYAPRDAAS